MVSKPFARAQRYGRSTGHVLLVLSRPVVGRQPPANERYELIGIEQWGAGTAIEDSSHSEDSVSAGFVGGHVVHDQ